MEHFDWGSDYYRKHGIMMPDDGADRLRGFGRDLLRRRRRAATCLTTSRSGACASPSASPSISTPMCARPASCLEFRVRCAVSEPKDLDWVIVRENSEGEYAGQGGRSHRGLPEEVATDVSIFTRAGVTRIMRFAFRWHARVRASC